MKLTRLSIIVIFVGILLIGCESKNMKNAKDFIALEDWVNATKKIQSEIENNPKNIEAYKLLLLAQQGLYFGGYDYSNFLNPNNANFAEFPKLDKEGSKKLFTTMERIERIEKNAIDAKYLFFKALYNYHEWNMTVLESESDGLKRLELYQKRCENDIFKEAINNFQKCADTESDVADNAFFWWRSFNCDTSYKIADFIKDFRLKYKSSDLKDEVDSVEFSSKLRVLVDQYKSKPDSTSIEKPLELVSAFMKSHPNFKSENEANVNLTIGYFLIDYVVRSNREYVSGKNMYKYSNAAGLIKYLIALSKATINKNINIKALESIAECYENTNEKNKAIELYQKILESKLDNGKEDEIHYKIGKAFQDINDYKNAVAHYNEISNLSDIEKYSLWKCFTEIGDTSESQKLREELEKSTNSTVKLLMQFAGPLKD